MLVVVEMINDHHLFQMMIMMNLIFLYLNHNREVNDVLNVFFQFVVVVVVVVDHH
jgi:hypothetical protein